MKKIIKRKSTFEPIDLVDSQVESDSTGLVNKIHEQLIALEKKVDILISKSMDRPVGSDRFQRPDSRFRRSERDRPRERNFTQAVCSQCGKECEIPFKPTGDRPVYCRDCFSARNDSGSSRGKFGDKPKEGGFSRGRSFDNRGPSKGTRPDKKRNSFFQKRKERF